MPKSRPAASQPAAAPRRSRVLIADDNEPNRELHRSEEHTSDLQSRHNISYAVFCLDRKSVV